MPGKLTFTSIYTRIMVFLSLTLFSVCACAQQPLTNADYKKIATAVLEHETGSDAGPWTIFVGFSDIEAKPLVPALQRIYKGKTIVKGSGEDWGNEANGCHVDKVTRTGATGIFMSSPHWRTAQDVAFQVTFAACATGSHQSIYVFKHSGDSWNLISVEPGYVS